jgi:hypothetical protein
MAATTGSHEQAEHEEEEEGEEGSGVHDAQRLGIGLKKSRVCNETVSLRMRN